MASTAELQQMARAAAMEAGVDPALFMGLVTQESSWNPNAHNPSGAYGLTQIMPGTAANPGMGLNGVSRSELKDPMVQLRFGAQYLKKMIDMNGGNIDKALASYNWGAGNVQKKGMGQMPAETRGYLTRVKGFADSFDDGSYEVGDNGGTMVPQDYGYVTEDSWADSPYANPGSMEGSDRDYDTFGSDAGEHFDYGGTGQSGIGDALKAGAKGAMSGMAYGNPVVGFAIGAIGGAIKGAYTDRQEQALREKGIDPDSEQGRQMMSDARNGFGIDDLFSTGLDMVTGGDVAGAATKAVSGIAGNLYDKAVTDPDKNRYGVTDVGKDVLTSAIGGDPMAGVVDAGKGVAKQAYNDYRGEAPSPPKPEETPEEKEKREDEEREFTGKEALSAGVKGYASGGLTGMIGNVAGGYLASYVGEKWDDWKDNRKAKKDAEKAKEQAGLQPGAAEATGAGLGEDLGPQSNRSPYAPVESARPPVNQTYANDVSYSNDYGSTDYSGTFGGGYSTPEARNARHGGNRAEEDARRTATGR